MHNRDDLPPKTQMHKQTTHLILSDISAHWLPPASSQNAKLYSSEGNKKLHSQLRCQYPSYVFRKLPPAKSLNESMKDKAEIKADKCSQSLIIDGCTITPIPAQKQASPLCNQKKKGCKITKEPPPTVKKWMKEAENDVQLFRIPCVCKRQFNQMTIPCWKRWGALFLNLNLVESINNCRKKHEKSISNNNKLSRQQEKDIREWVLLPSILSSASCEMSECVCETFGG